MATWLAFCREFERLSREAGRKQYILPYIIAAFPGSNLNHMKSCRNLLERMGALPRQVQVFLPTPMTVAAAVYHTGLNHETGEPVEVPRKPSQKAAQKEAIVGGITTGEPEKPPWLREGRRPPEARSAAKPHGPGKRRTT